MLNKSHLAVIFNPGCAAPMTRSARNCLRHLTLLLDMETYLLPALLLQCFDAIGWAAGRASGLYKTEW